MKINCVRVNFTLPENVYDAFRIIIPKRQRSRVISELLKEEIERREKSLAEIARAVENDKDLHQEMASWDSTLNDGLDDLPWK